MSKTTSQRGARHAARERRQDQESRPASLLPVPVELALPLPVEPSSDQSEITPPATETVGTALGFANVNPAWPGFEQDEKSPAANACGQTLWKISLGYARIFCNNPRFDNPEDLIEDFAGAGILKVFMKMKAGKFHKAKNPWGLACTIIERAIRDEADLFRNTHERQPSVLENKEGEQEDTDEALERINADYGPLFKAQPINRRELNRLEAFVDDALWELPDNGKLLKLRFGFYRDTVGHLEPMTPAMLAHAPLHFGFDVHSEADVYRAIREYLRQLRAILVRKIKKTGFRLPFKS